ncbi:ankyrin repeat domain-containing protein [Variovorax sp. N23]|uniref:ankyrin repeat domain-containing protein n=1 Tax=Variovorax sp. N23 TaxID=2980555 RepID=UPI0021C8BDBA|nr:ankyrin repeat domain-containing protein [Variovorax sp. N23]MCU4120058.1 ankyrin repeat domain-containing protein [Variovorax sp. N23]
MRNLARFCLYLLAVTVFSAAQADSFNDFFRAVRSDNASGVESLLRRGFDPNTRDEHGMTGLLLAIREPSPRVIQVLLASPQIKVELRNGNDESPLMLAAIKGQMDLVKQLIARDADINKPGWTALHYAASSGQVEIMKLLLEKYAFIDAQSPNGTTPLMMAAMYGSPESVKLLLDEGADPSMKNQQNMTAMDFAVRGQRPDAVELLKSAVRAKASGDGKW